MDLFRHLLFSGYVEKFFQLASLLLDVGYRYSLDGIPFYRSSFMDTAVFQGILYSKPYDAMESYVAYSISMTEWIILLRIIYLWKKDMSKARKKRFSVSYKLMMLSDFWIILNLFLALLISIPAVNLFTHGTHITVAHSMGTIIGINTLILLSSISFILEDFKQLTNRCKKNISIGLKIFNISFIGFWIVLIIMGIKRSHWLYISDSISFSRFQESSHSLYIIFGIFGIGLLVGLYVVIYQLISSMFKIIIYPK